MKSEPSVFSVEDLRRSKDRTTGWDGVRNYQARNTLRDRIKPGDGVLFYHSNSEPSGIAGEAVVVRGGYPDNTAYDPSDIHFDPRSERQNPTWYQVDVKFIRACKEVISLNRLREIPTLSQIMVLKKGSRLSVQPVRPQEWRTIMELPEWG